MVQWQRRIRSGSIRLGKGIQNLGFGAFSVHFCAYKSEPGVRGRSPRRSAPEHRLQQPLLPEGHIVIICHDDVVRQADMHRLQGPFDL